MSIGSEIKSYLELGREIARQKYGFSINGAPGAIDIAKGGEWKTFMPTN